MPYVSTCELGKTRWQLVGGIGGLSTWPQMPGRAGLVSASLHLPVPTFPHHAPCRHGTPLVSFGPPMALSRTKGSIEKL